MISYEDHPIANLFPLLPEAELNDLAADIKANGLRQAIVLHEGKILDGRNRYRACVKAGVTPRTELFMGDSPTAFVVSLNLHRRHLTPSQHAACSVESIPFLEKEALERRKATEGRPSKVEKLSQKVDAVSSDRNAGRAMSQAASLFHTNRQYVYDAKAIKEKAPEQFEAIRRGEKTITEVKRELKRKDVVEKVAAMPSSKYRVIYADPPWKYGDSREKLEGTTGASAHYPSMTISELCALPVGELAEENSVLFMWTTSPLLYECAPVFRAWGFEYKACFVWDKVRHNMGHYNSVRHEFLLVCTKGSCTPDNVKLFDSVQSVERTDKHSEKPEEFRDIINTLYPHGKRIELFARAAVKGWERWGNQV